MPQDHLGGVGLGSSGSTASNYWGSALGSAGIQAGAGAVSSFTGALANRLDWRHQQRQADYYDKLQRGMMKYQGDVNFANWQKQFDMSNAYNTPLAQRRRMEEAGYNLALMYGKGAPTNISQPVPGANVGLGSTTKGEQGRTTPQGISDLFGHQAIRNATSITEAEVALKREETRKARIEANKTAGVDTEKTEVEIVGIELDNKLKEINNRIAIGTESYIIEQEIQKAIQAGAEAQRKLIALKKEDATAEAEIDRIIAESNNTILRGKLIQAQIGKTEQEITNLQQTAKLILSETQLNNAKFRNEWMAMSFKEREVALKEEMNKLKEKGLNIQQQATDYNTSTAAYVRQWTDILTSFIPLAGGSTAGKIGF